MFWNFSIFEIFHKYVTKNRCDVCKPKIFSVGRLPKGAINLVSHNYITPDLFPGLGTIICDELCRVCGMTAASFKFQSEIIRTVNLQ